MIYSYNDIIAAYDEPLRKNNEWSVFVLPESIPYFNTFIHNAAVLSNTAVMMCLANYCFVFDNDDFEVPLHRRLLGLREVFAHIPFSTYLSFVDEIVEAHAKGETKFTPNANAKSIKNPYYKFSTHVLKHEKAEIIKEHRRELKALYSNPTLDRELYEYLESYDLNEGLLSKEKIKRSLDCTRFNLDRCFTRNKFLQEMFDGIRQASYKSSYKRRKK